MKMLKIIFITLIIVACMFAIVKVLAFLLKAVAIGFILALVAIPVIFVFWVVKLFKKKQKV